MTGLDKNYTNLMRRSGDLVAFCMVCEERNLTKAAERLGISQPSLSKRMKNVEVYLGKPLFQRTSRGLDLTAAAQNLLLEVEPVVRSLSVSLARAMRNKETDRVVVAADFAFASFWLIPRIARIRSDLGITDIQVLSSQTPQLSSAHADLVVYLSEPKNVLETSDCLFRESVSAVCSPSYLAEHGPLHNFDQLDLHTLIHLSNTDGSTPWFDWTTWLLEAYGVTLAPPPGTEVNSYEMVLKLARAGEGLALGWHGLIDDFLDNGELVVASANAMTSKRAYFVSDGTSVSNKSAKVVREWITDQCRRDSEVDDLYRGSVPR